MGFNPLERVMPMRQRLGCARGTWFTPAPSPRRGGEPALSLSKGLGRGGLPRVDAMRFNRSDSPTYGSDHVDHPRRLPAKWATAWLPSPSPRPSPARGEGETILCAEINVHLCITRSRGNDGVRRPLPKAGPCFRFNRSENDPSRLQRRTELIPNDSATLPHPPIGGRV